MRSAAPLLFCLACAPKPTATEPAPSAEAGPSNVLTVADIRIADGVDTTSAATLEAVNCLRRFLTRKMDPEAPNDHWYARDLEDYDGPYAELRYAEYDSVGDLRYRPTVVEARPAGEGELLVKVMWSDAPGTQDLSTANYAFEFLVRSTEEGARVFSTNVLDGTDGPLTRSMHARSAAKRYLRHLRHLCTVQEHPSVRSVRGSAKYPCRRLALCEPSAAWPPTHRWISATGAPRPNATINEDASVPYVIGAVLCERILRRDGKAGLFQVMAEGVDPWPALARYGITPETLTAELRKELVLEPWRL